MSNVAIDNAVRWLNSLCKVDKRCMLRDGHKDDHSDLFKSWPR